MKTIITFTGPSCSGKSTLLKYLEAQGYPKIISHTTRLPRHGEIDGDDYYFITENDYDGLVDHDLFMETSEHNGFRYGITKKEIEDKLSEEKPAFIILNLDGLEKFDEYCDQHYIRIYHFYVRANVEILVNRFIDRINSDIADLSDEKQIKLSLDRNLNRLKHCFEYERDWDDEHYDFRLNGADTPEVNLSMIDKFLELVA